MMMNYFRCGIFGVVSGMAAISLLTLGEDGMAVSVGLLCIMYASTFWSRDHD